MRQDDVDAAGQGQTALARAQAAARQMDGDERRGAGGIDRQTRAVQAQRERHAARRDAVHVAGRVVRIPLFPRLAHRDLLVIGRARAEEHARVAAVERRGRNGGVFERFPRDFQQQPMLRVHLPGLARRNAEEPRVELVQRPGQQPRPAWRVPVRFHAQPRPSRIERLDRVTSGFQERPVRLGIVSAAGEAASQSDDGNRLGFLRFQKVSLGLRLPEGKRRVAKTLDQQSVLLGHSIPCLSL